MTTATQAQDALMRIIQEDDGNIIGAAMLTTDDLLWMDGRQTRDDYSFDAVCDAMLEAGRRELSKQTRPGCDCADCSDDTCPEGDA